MKHDNLKYWPTHWAGGNNSTNINGENVCWLEFEDGPQVALIKPHHRKSTTDEEIKFAARLAGSWNFLNEIEKMGYNKEQVISILQRLYPKKD